ncbi:11087_t:CDS:2, partial [Funneliformis mosseae]
ESLGPGSFWNVNITSLESGIYKPLFRIWWNLEVFEFSLEDGWNLGVFDM